MEFGKNLLFLAPALFLGALAARWLAGRWAVAERLIAAPNTFGWIFASAVAAVALPLLAQGAFTLGAMFLAAPMARFAALALFGVMYGLFVGTQSYFSAWQSAGWGLVAGCLGAVAFPFLPAALAPIVPGILIAFAPILGLAVMPGSRQRPFTMGGASYPIGGKWH